MYRLIIWIIVFATGLKVIAVITPNFCAWYCIATIQSVHCYTAINSCITRGWRYTIKTTLMEATHIFMYVCGYIHGHTIFTRSVAVYRSNISDCYGHLALNMSVTLTTLCIVLMTLVSNDLALSSLSSTSVWRMHMKMMYMGRPEICCRARWGCRSARGWYDTCVCKNWAVRGNI